ncbi:hypothetical protein BE08_05720 [Sorangium cellulosum]|uniref:Non-hemolytic enterotoxin lytic component L1 n=1 Tax=Sorangium cellulosum TaxID=56 RepID=A0A150PHN9_SORCE|nr:hypothetical protein BE08_05720 [Sorangium cellulosum]
MSIAANDPQSTSDLQKQTQSAFVMLSLITQACHGILNTVFIAPDPKPSWFDDLNDKLDAAKTVATDWIDNLAPGVTGGVPTHVIDYGTTYQAFTAKIDAIATQYPDAQGADDPHVKEVHDLIAALEETVQSILDSAQKTADQLKGWGDRVQKAHDELSTGAANIQSAETTLQADIDKMNNAIQTLQDTIHQENIGIAASGAGIGVGLLLLIVGIALAPETGGASLVVAGTGGLLVIGGAVTWGVMQHKINEQFDEIAKDQAEKDSDQRQIVALQGLAIASSQSIAYTTDASSALSNFRTAWNVFQGELQGVRDKLLHGQSSLRVIVADAFTDAAAQEWQDATSFAQSLVNAPVSFPSAQLPMSSSTLAAVA